ncbi:MAG: LacI family DNA-binding transcriptional regulator [Clostridiales bacterium]|nr:LacI family DNA-binding transcriptional regulator [Clostridiales bacterium]
MTIKEIARLAGVSISTVSKIMNQKDEGISQETRERVLKIAKEFHYSPHSSAFAGGNKTFLLGVLIHSADAGQALDGILEEAREHGYTVLISRGDGSNESEYRGISALCRYQADAVLWEPVNEDSMQYAASFQAASIPCLRFHPVLESDVFLDFEGLGYAATSSLAAAGHQETACLLSPCIWTDSFLTGYKRCLFDAGLSFRESRVFQEVNDALLQDIADHRITGIVCSHFAAALKLYGELNRIHCQLPHDVSLVSLRRDEQENAFSRISAIPIPYRAYGQHLCRQMIHYAEHKEPFRQFLTSPAPDSSVTIGAPFSRQQKKLLVVGSINIDHYMKMDEFPVSGRAVLTSDPSQYPGGKGINQAIGSSRLGAQVALIGMTGNDADSGSIFSVLEEYSIDSGGVCRCPDAATGKAYIFLQRDGDSMISILPGANECLTASYIRRQDALFRQGSCCLMQTEVPQQALIEAGRLARHHGMRTILKPAACSFLEPELLKYTDILVPNLDEVNLLCPEKSLSEQAEQFLALGVKTVIITLGADGCYLKTQQEEQYFPAADFTAVDNTGAGDAFICALAVYLQTGYSMTDAIRIATCAAGFSISREGVVPALIDRHTLESYIRQKEPGLLL